MLLEHGADPNKRYFFGSEINLVSPLDLEFMRLLLTFGAHPDTRDRAGLTPLMKAARLPQVSLHNIVISLFNPFETRLYSLNMDFPIT
jgi:ankyrin repeat protein